MGRLFDLIQAHVDAQPYEVTLAQVARKVGVSRQTILNWKTPTKLIDKRHLVAVSEVTGVPYQRVLDALLEDIGYLRADDRPTALSDRRSRVTGTDLAGLPSVAHKPRKPKGRTES